MNYSEVYDSNQVIGAGNDTLTIHEKALDHNADLFGFTVTRPRSMLGESPTNNIRRPKFKICKHS